MEDLQKDEIIEHKSLNARISNALPLRVSRKMEMDFDDYFERVRRFRNGNLF